MSLLLSSMLSKMRLAMFEYILISECVTISKWQLSSTLAIMIMKTDHEYLILTKHLLKYTLDLFLATQTVKVLPNANALTNKFQGLCHVKLHPQDTYLLSQIGYVICHADVTNKTNIHLSFIKCILVTRSILSTELYAMVHLLDIKKLHWERYQSMQKKLH